MSKHQKNKEIQPPVSCCRLASREGATTCNRVCPSSLALHITILQLSQSEQQCTACLSSEYIHIHQPLYASMESLALSNNSIATPPPTGLFSSPTIPIGSMFYNLCHRLSLNPPPCTRTPNWYVSVFIVLLPLNIVAFPQQGWGRHPQGHARVDHQARTGKRCCQLPAILGSIHGVKGTYR